MYRKSKNKVFLNVRNDSLDKKIQIYNLPFKCYNKVNKLKDNISLYLYGTILFLLIVFTIINWVKPVKSVYAPISNPPIFPSQSEQISENSETINNVNDTSEEENEVHNENNDENINMRNEINDENINMNN